MGSKELLEPALQGWGRPWVVCAQAETQLGVPALKPEWVRSFSFTKFCLCVRMIARVKCDLDCFALFSCFLEDNCTHALAEVPCCMQNHSKQRLTPLGLHRTQ